MIAGAFDPIAIFEAVAPAVVSVLADGGAGTGFFVNASGHIVTNYHVVQGASAVKVGLRRRCHHGWDRAGVRQCQ